MVTSLTEAGAQVIATDLSGVDHRLDETSQGEWAALAATVEREHGALDILVNNAGRVLVKPLGDTGLVEWQALFAVNIEGAFLGARTMLPLLRAGAAWHAAGASVIMMSSVAGIGGGARMGAYCATKDAIRLFAKACAMEFAGDRIRVNSVHPGGVDTPMLAEIGDAYTAQGIAPSSAEAFRPRRRASARPAGDAKRDRARGALFWRRTRPPV